MDLDKLLDEMDGFSGAEIRAVSTEAGYCAIRANRRHIVLRDFLHAIEKVKQSEDSESGEFLEMFG